MERGGLCVMCCELCVGRGGRWREGGAPRHPSPCTQPTSHTRHPSPSILPPLSPLTALTTSYRDHPSPFISPSISLHTALTTSPLLLHFPVPCYTHATPLPSSPRTMSDTRHPFPFISRTHPTPCHTHATPLPSSRSLSPHPPPRSMSHTRHPSPFNSSLGTISLVCLCQEGYTCFDLKKRKKKQKTGAFLWNTLPLTDRSCHSLSSFKRKRRVHLEAVTQDGL